MSYKHIKDFDKFEILSTDKIIWIDPHQKKQRDVIVCYYCPDLHNSTRNFVVVRGLTIGRFIVGEVLIIEIVYLNRQHIIKTNILRRFKYNSSSRSL